MNIEEYRVYCMNKLAVTEEFPFDNRTLVFKVAGKMFALCDVENFESVNLKCDPEKAVELRELHDGITPGYHMNKQHWNTILTQAEVPDKLIFTLIDHSYELVVGSLTKKIKQEFSL